MNFKNIYYNLLMPLLILAVLYVCLRMLKITILRFAKSSKVIKIVESIDRKVELLLPPLAILVLMINLLWLDVKIYGPLLALMFVIFFKQIKSYGLGKMMQYQGRINNGYHISGDGIKGKISRLNPFEIKIESDLGPKYISYTELQKKVHTISTFENVPVKYQFEVRVSSDIKQEKYIRNIKFLLLETPQVESHSALEIITLGDDKNIRITLCIGAEYQIEELKQLLDEKKIEAFNWSAIK